MDNQQFRFIFRDIANLLELQEDDPFRVRAYRRAAQTIDHLGESLRLIAQRNALEELPGIGKTLAREIRELLEVGHLRYHEHLKSTVPEGILALLRLPSLTPEHVRRLWREHNITSVTQLTQAMHEQRLPVDASTLERLHHDLKTWQRQRQRTLLGIALPRAETLLANLSRLPLVDRLSLAGSLRRGVDRVGDLNIVMASSDPPQLIHHCNQQPEVHEIIETGPTSTRLVISEGLRLSLVAALPSQFASVLHHYTGSTAYLTALQRLALQRGWRLTAYGLTSLQGGNPIPIATEQDLYQHLGLPYIAPELRENRGELEAAQTDSLPQLVSMEQVRGDLHVRSDWDTGAHSLEDIAQAAQRMGYQYVAICDYVCGAAGHHGISAAKLVEQLTAIRRLNSTFSGAFRLLAGAEVEISPEGFLELDEDILQELDIVIAAVHTGLKDPRHKLTRRLCQAMEHPLVHILAHPTGRILGREETPSIDIEALIEAAVDTHTCLEINSHMLRLDLPDHDVQQARDLGVTFSLGSYARTIRDMRAMHLGVLTARRGWVEPRQLLNTLAYPQLLQRLKDQDVTNVT